ncbi:hypothetical protein H8356DRAFT_937488, partial [Neocallimastix lanati (nom. inval.)]
LYTYEIINQDRSVFLPNEPERIINDYIYKLEKIQEELKLGTYGGPTFDRYPQFDYILKENGCHRIPNIGSSCDTVVYETPYGFSKDLGTLPINELLREYLFYVKNFIKDVEHNKYIRLPFNSRDNIEIIYNQIKESDFFKLQNDIITNLYNALQFLDNQLIDLTIKMLDENSQSIIWLIILGMIMFLILGYFVINQLYKEKIKEMNTLVSFIFLVPPSIISKNEKFKR